MVFASRRHAGRLLADLLQPLRGSEPIVLALPRGGVPVAVEVARALGAPLDLLTVRKLGAPADPEFAIGAVAEDGTAVLDQVAARHLGIDQAQLDGIVAREERELRRRIARFRGRRPPLDVSGRTVIVVDDGLATGLTDLAAVRALARRGAGRIVVAAPVASSEAVRMLSHAADEVICHTVSGDLRGVGRWYEDFSQVSDEEVLALLAEEPPAGSPDAEAGEQVIEVDGVRMKGDLVVPPRARGLVLFAHGSGSSRLSPRNRLIARRLEAAGLATLLLDLLADHEEGRRDLAFDIPLLTGRLEGATRWALADPRTRGLGIGYFGASTGAAAALRAAASWTEVRAVVSRGGRPDLAADRLADVHAPTLLIVGSLDRDVLELNRRAGAFLAGPHRLAIVPGAGHLFEEPGGLEAVADLATGWFLEHLTSVPLARAAEA